MRKYGFYRYPRNALKYQNEVSLLLQKPLHKYNHDITVVCIYILGIVLAWNTYFTHYNTFPFVLFLCITFLDTFNQAYDEFPVGNEITMSQ